jgi:hypothetical protein
VQITNSNSNCMKFDCAWGLLRKKSFTTGKALVGLLTFPA